VLVRGFKIGLRNRMGIPKVKVWNGKGFGRVLVDACQLFVLNAMQSHVKLLQSVGDVAECETLMKVVWHILIEWVVG